MNIAEIKERFDKFDFVHSFTDENGCDDEWKDAHEPIGYLLSIIKQAEKALEAYQDFEQRANCNWCGDGVRDVVNEALKAIRRN